MTLAAAVVDEVRRRMIACEMSQTALARAAGMPPTLIHRAMTGGRALQLDEVERIAPALGITVEWLLSCAIRRGPRSGEVRRAASESTQV